MKKVTSNTAINENIINMYSPDILQKYQINTEYNEKDYDKVISPNSMIRKTITFGKSKDRMKQISIYLKSKNQKIKNCSLYLFKRMIMITTHLTLIALFEILFFFHFVSKYEDNALIYLVNSFVSNIPNICNSLTLQEKALFTGYFNQYVNITNIEEQSIIAKDNRIIFNNGLDKTSWIYFSIIIGISFLLILIHIIGKIKVSLRKIIIDNVLMIIILGIFEYVFFTRIIMIYQNISLEELEVIIINSLNLCLV